MLPMSSMSLSMLSQGARALGSNCCWALLTLQRSTGRLNRCTRRLRTGMRWALRLQGLGHTCASFDTALCGHGLAPAAAARPFGSLSRPGFSIAVWCSILDRPHRWPVCKSVATDTWRTLQAAIRLYSKCGFEDVTEQLAPSMDVPAQLKIGELSHCRHAAANCFKQQAETYSTVMFWPAGQVRLLKAKLPLSCQI